MQVGRSGFRHALLQQQHAGLELRVGGEAPLHGLVQQQSGQGEEAHALMVGHERADHDGVLPGGQACLAVVHGLVEPEAPSHAKRGQPLQVAAGGSGRHHQGQCAGIGRHHALFTQATLEAQPRDAERPVLVVEMCVQRIVGRFRDTPGQARQLAVFDLPFDGGVAGLVE
ncbi:hypothetical protein D3C80_452050 [compost metagenome]